MTEMGAPGSEYNVSFNKVLQGTIKDTLNDVFGKKSAITIIETMAKDYFLKLEDVPERSQQFNGALKLILGSGHQIIEDLILENLSSKLGHKIDYRGDYTFADYLSQLKKCGYDRVT
jgi:hypothetical protein